MRAMCFGAVMIAAMTGGAWAAGAAHPQAVSPQAQAQARQELSTGFSLLQQGKVDEAIAHTTVAATLDPRFGDAQFNLGVMYGQKHDWAQAIRHMKKAAALMPDSLNVHFNLGVYYQTTGKDQPAETEYRKALRIDPDHVASHLNLGILLAKKRSPEANMHCRRAIELNPALDTPSCPR